jgi:deoxynucleoside triphosphate triphosphohydrolase SAMHD1
VTGAAPAKPAELVAELEDVCARWLAPQKARLRATQALPRPKVVNDLLWGSIRLDSWEVALLDSLLLQRLRYLKQLGVVHWVFPGAAHSRLEHSLGVLHQMQQLLDGLERNSGLAGARLVDDVTSKLLRMAALVHDCGHAMLSHVSERFIESLPQVDELITWTTANYRTRKRPSASEAFAAVFIESSAFVEFLGMREVGADFIRDPAAAAHRIAGFLLGGPVEPGAEYLSLLVNGAFDADKLDYMPRDSLMAGIPCAVDVARVAEKIHCLTLPVGRLSKAYAEWATPQDGFVRILALSSSGARALHELAVTRSLLYDKVYYHQKVLSAQLVVHRLLESKRAARDITSVSQWLEITDEQLLMDERPYAQLLRQRRLPKRAFFITQPTVSGEPADPEAPVTGVPVKGSPRDWRRIRLDWTNGALGNRILAETSKVAGLLDRGVDALRELPPELDFPNQTKLGLDQFAFVGDGPEDFQTADEGLSGERPETSKRLSRAGGFVFAAEEAVLPVFIATRTVLRRDYGQEYGSACYAPTKLDPQDIAAAENRLETAGYFDALPNGRPERLPPARLRSHRAHALEIFLKTAWPRIRLLGETFGRYQAVGTRPVSPRHIAQYLRQFETEGLARGALRLLENIKFKDRKYFADALLALIQRVEKTRDVEFVCPLGGTGDSSTLLSYLMNDLPPEWRRPVVQIEVALPRRNRGAIVLWDEFCGDGGHSRTVLSQWLSLNDDVLDERLVDPLSAELAKLFSESPLHLVFALGRQSGLGKTRAFIDKHALKNVTVVDPTEIVSDDDSVFEGTAVFKDGAERDNLRAFLEGVGRKLHEPKKSRTDARQWTEKDVDTRLLGYGNTAQLLVFYYNVPTVTLTALWEGGAGWEPLFPRRPKLAATRK